MRKSRLHNSGLKWLIAYVTIIGNFIAMLDSSTVNIALYEISKTLNEPITSVQWVVVGYMLILTVFLPFFGKLSDICRRNKLYASGFLIFALGSFLSFLSNNLPMLIASRCVEAFGASILVSNSVVIIASMFRGRKRGKALGVNGAIVALGSMSGPALSGILINYFGWNSIFLPGCFIALLFAFFSYKLIPAYRAPRKKEKFDYKGFLYFTIFLFSLLTTISQGHIWGWSSKKITALVVIFIVATIMFVIRELKVSYALINFSLFKIKSFTLGNIALNLSYWGVAGMGVLFPLFAQRAMGFSPMITGFIVLCYAVSLIVVAPISGNIAGKKGSRWLTFFGGLLFTISLLLFSTFNAQTPVYMLVLAQMMLGTANGLFQSPSNMGVLADVDSKNLGTAGGILALARNSGMIIGIAMAINILEIFEHLFRAQNGNAFLFAYQHTAFVLSLFALTCTLFAYFAYKNENRKTI